MIRLRKLSEGAHSISVHELKIEQGDWYWRHTITIQGTGRHMQWWGNDAIRISTPEAERK